MRKTTFRAFLTTLMCSVTLVYGQTVAQAPSLAPTADPVGRPQKPTPVATAEEPISFVPLPMYATLPNEGPTYGFMPVFLDSDDTGRIYAITAPSLSWNGVSHITATGRYYQYPDEFEERLFNVTYASRLYREAMADWILQPTTKGRRTHHFSFQYRKDPYRRFFGIGKDTGRTDESTYTLESIRSFAKVGYNLTGRVNAHFTLGFNWFAPRDHGVLGIKPLFEEHHYVNGLQGTTTLYSLVGLRYDTRDLREFSDEGILIDTGFGLARSREAKDHGYGLAKVEGRALWQEFSRLHGAFRVYWNYAYGSDIPFYERPSLGGSFFLRGFILDRFVDNGAWSIDFEQRITALIVHVQGTEVHLKIDPFITVGQVYQDTSEMFSRVQYAPGVGIRFFSPPNVLGRIDIAKGGPDLNVYMELGYPF